MQRTDISDVFRNHRPDFSCVKPEHADELVRMLNADNPYEILFQSHLSQDFDQLGLTVGYAYVEGKITQDQFATLMMLIDLKKEKIHFTVKETLASGQLINKLSRFVDLLNQKPNSERYMFTVEMDISTLDPRVETLLELAERLQLIIKSPSRQQSMLQISIMSTGAMDALAKAKFHEHAKARCPVPGKLSREDMDNYIQAGKRPIATYFTGIESETEFHGIKAPMVFLSLHDNIHHQLVSSIPNYAYDALLEAIKLVREKTNIFMSKDIWSALDMEVGDFLDLDASLFSSNHLVTKTHHFKTLLSAKVHTEGRTGGLFAGSALNDTFWLLMIDIYLHPDKWKKLSVDPESFTSDYKSFYDFIKTHFPDALKTQSAATQVAFIKSDWFGLSYTAEQETVFVKTSGGYIQVEVEGKPILGSKKTFIACEDVHANSAAYPLSLRYKEGVAQLIREGKETLLKSLEKYRYIGQPYESQDFIHEALENPHYFFQSPTSSADLVKRFSILFPDKKAFVIDHLLQHPREFRSFNRNTAMIELLPDYCPLKRDAVILQLLANANETLWNNFRLNLFMTRYPEYTHALFDWFLNGTNVFNSSVADLKELNVIVNHTPPEQLHRLVQYLTDYYSFPTKKILAIADPTDRIIFEKMLTSKLEEAPPSSQKQLSKAIEAYQTISAPKPQSLIMPSTLFLQPVPSSEKEVHGLSRQPSTLNHGI